ncbi:hypothetical protein JKF63_03488 [Porcisia hertigi]|uniref:Homologous recombination OB-fold protein OB-fold domain-containing protein n=1 Tax=Porcisia hertigi TaxID=2761500 RepID=A0A836ILF5_9TRYP|nr:hypothetical protein JKF63_03488 [Porcisia hertigi]
MDPQQVLESLAREKGVALTHLADISRKYSQSAKVACCGGVMTRVVTESAADSTVLLHDSSGSCYCALHGDITSRYSDILTTGALLLFTDITVLVVSSKVPPMLIACLQNLAGLLLPDKVTKAAAAAAAAAAVAVPRGTKTAGLRCSSGRTLLSCSAMSSNDNVARSDMQPPQSLRSGRRGYEDFDLLANPRSTEGSYAEPHASTDAGPLSQHTPGGARHDTLPAAKRPRAESNTASAALEVDDEDDAECLELVDGI